MALGTSSSYIPSEEDTVDDLDVIDPATGLPRKKTQSRLPAYSGPDAITNVRSGPFPGQPGYQGNTGIVPPEFPSSSAVPPGATPAPIAVSLPGWDPRRTDNDPKYVFGRFVQSWQASGKPWGAEGARAFVAQDPRWEIDPQSSPDDPRIRVKQAELDKWKPGQSVWQDVIRDSGPGGANAPMFENSGTAQATPNLPQQLRAISPFAPFMTSTPAPTASMLPTAPIRPSPTSSVPFTPDPESVPGIPVWSSPAPFRPAPPPVVSEPASTVPYTPSTPPSIPPGSIFETPGATGPQSGPLFDLLMRRATQSLDIDSTDPIIKAQTDAYGARQERASRNYLSGLAERAGPSANIGAEARSSAEQAGQATGAFEAELIGRELSTRRQEIEGALSGAAGLLTAEQQMQLQEELAKISLAQQQHQFTATQGQQESQFGRSLVSGEEQFEKMLAQRGHEFTQGQGQQESQFGRQQGQQESQFGRSLTQRGFEFTQGQAQQESQFGRSLTAQEFQFAQSLAQRGFEFTQAQGQQESQFARAQALMESQFGRSLSQRELEALRSLQQRAYEFDATNQYQNSPLAA